MGCIHEHGGVIDSHMYMCVSMVTHMCSHKQFTYCIRKRLYGIAGKFNRKLKLAVWRIIQSTAKVKSAKIYFVLPVFLNGIFETKLSRQLIKCSGYTGLLLPVSMMIASIFYMYSYTKMYLLTRT